MASNKTKPVSYRRNRDYNTHFKWTYELHFDVHNCYIRVREDLSIGYMKRLKKYWDEIYPEFNFFAEKQLRQQPIFIEKKKLVLQCNQDSINSEELESHDGSNVINITDDDNHLTSVSETSNHNGNPTPLNSFRTDNDFNCELKETLRANFLENIERFQTIPLKETSYYTKIIRKPSENEIRIIDNIANEYATNIMSDKTILDY